ncbi:hypothetical protein, partial [Pseudomonas aeruginosa]|uniref:hypothetical protein n=1 Tax=Pseudomonas aeruginosa TaxID=287 RepID=UPI0019D205DE
MPAALQSAWRGGGRGAAVSLGGVFHEPGRPPPGKSGAAPAGGEKKKNNRVNLFIKNNVFVLLT